MITSEQTYPYDNNLCGNSITKIFNNWIKLSGRWVPGMSRGFHCDQPAPGQWNTRIANNPITQPSAAMSPHTGTSRHP